MASALTAGAVEGDEGDASPYAQEGPFVGVRGSLLTTVFTDDSQGGSVDSAVGLSGILDVGYRLHPHLALEGVLEVAYGANWLIFDEDYDLTSATFTANARLFLLPWRAQPYLVAGFGPAITHVDSDSPRKKSKTRGHFVGRAGLGADFYATESLSLGLELAFGFGTSDYLQITPSLGLAYRF